MSTERRTFVIVGGGLAGAEAARTLREEGFDGRLVLLAEESEPPYHRPGLSKDYLRGESSRDALDVHPPAFYAENDIELRLGEPVVELDIRGRQVVLAGGARLRFDALLLATGASARRLPVPGAGLAGVQTLRTLTDADRLAATLAGAARLVVVGAGFIGTEIAASARQLGVEVALVDPLAAPLERILGVEVGGIFRDLHVEHGVEVLSGAIVAGFEGAGRVERVRLGDGRSLGCDAVVVGIGAAPRTELAQAAGLAVADGILVDGRGETSVPGIFAAGDVAAHLHPLLGRRRVEHWANALNQGPAVARAMLGAPDAYDRLPYFFSDQYDLGMEYAGHGDGTQRVVIRGDRERRELIAFWLEDGRVSAGMNVNVWDVTDDIQALIAARVVVDEVRLADQDVPLSALLPAAGVTRGSTGGSADGAS